MFIRFALYRQIPVAFQPTHVLKVSPLLGQLRHHRLPFPALCPCGRASGWAPSQELSCAKLLPQAARSPGQASSISLAVLPQGYVLAAQPVPASHVYGKLSQLC